MVLAMRRRIADQMVTDDLLNRRARADVRQIDLAVELGISRRALQDYEAGRCPMPKARTNADYIAAIVAIHMRREAQREKVS